MEREKVIISVFGNNIRLPLERWAHIIESHDYMAGCMDMVLETVISPDEIIETEWEHYALKDYEKTPVGKKTAIIIYKDIPDGFIITALLTSRPRQFIKRGNIVWKK